MSAKKFEDRSIPIELVYEKATYSVPVKGKGTLKILDNISGKLEAGSMTCILGASGAGKTTLLNLLSGRILRQSGDELSGRVLVNGVESTFETFKLVTSYVTQDDILPNLLTPREILSFTCTMRHPGISKEEVDKKVNRALETVQVMHRADTVVGTPGLVRGLSGGERKRVNIAQGLVADPLVMFLDEPTSGLDSTAAAIVTKQLRELCTRERKTILTTLHQPSKDMLNLFDQVIILGKGRVVYAGPPDEMVEYFESIGHKCPRTMNPASFALSLTSVFGKKEDEARRKIHGLADDFKNSNRGDRIAPSRGLPPPNLNQDDFLQPTFAQFGHLLKRTALMTVRNPLLVRARIGQTIGAGVMIGIFFLRLGLSQNGAFDRIGAIFILQMQAMILSLVSVLTTFPLERPLFLRERSDGTYGSIVYFMSKTLIDSPFQVIFPFIQTCVVYFIVGFQADASKFFWYAGSTIMLSISGASMGFIISGGTKSVIYALAASSSVIVPQVLFSGFIVNNLRIPEALNWLRFINPLKYSVALTFMNEMRGLTFRCDVGEICRFRSGQDVLDNLLIESDTSELWLNLVILGALGLLYRVIGAAIFFLTTRRYIPH